MKSTQEWDPDFQGDDGETQERKKERRKERTRAAARYCFLEWHSRWFNARSPLPWK